MLQFYKELKLYFKHIIHPRRLIISSEKKVMQFPVGVGLQLAILLLFACGVAWSSYATGRFIAARSTLEAQRDTIRSVTATKTSNINILSSVLPNSDTGTESAEKLAILHDSRTKVAMLEKQVADLKNANEAIVERVRLKTDGHLDALESIVSQTGLNPDKIQKRSSKLQKSEEDDAEGGPYIPTDMPAISDEANEMLDSLDRLHTMRKVVANLPLGLPISNAEERSPFGHRIDPFNGNIAFHSGLDLAGPYGTPIHSAADGVVVSSGRDGAYGNMVDIDHGFGIVTRYGHLSAINVNKGSKVKKGDVIGMEGSTGRSTGPHLHYEVRYNGEAINPEKFLQTGKLLELGGVPKDKPRHKR